MFYDIVDGISPFDRKKNYEYSRFRIVGEEKKRTAIISGTIINIVPYLMVVHIDLWRLFVFIPRSSSQLFNYRVFKKIVWTAEQNVVSQNWNAIIREYFILERR